MSNTLEYILSLNDQMSSKLNKIGITSDSALHKFSKLEQQANKTSKLMKDMGGSVGALREKLNLLKAEKEWIPQSNIEGLRKYNSEIKKLEKEITKLDTINGSTFKKNLRGAIDNLPFSNLLTNPITQVGAALFATGKMAYKFDEGMAKINTTAQLTPPELNKLKNELLGIGRDTGANLGLIPEAYEKILSQTGDVALSTDILKTALKGSKAGFTDATTVADALSQSLSLIGSQNTNAQEVMDTFFAAKRVGAGEFKDFAAYMPGLIASGKALGVNFKETAGMFAYMTGKGQSAERSAVLMENAFAAMGKVDVRKNLKSAGISIFDKKGTMRSMDEIFKDLNSRMNGMSDEGKSSFLAKMGLVDKEARSAFIIMASDAQKLKTTMGDVANSQGETDKAFELSRNGMQRLQEVWAKIQSIGIQVGGVVATVVAPVFELLATIIDGVIFSFTWLYTKIAEGNPFMMGLVFVLGTIATSMLLVKAGMVAQAAWSGIVTLATSIQTGSWWALNAAMWANPVVWIIAGIIALIAIIVYLITRIDGWGKMWDYTMKAIGAYWDTLIGGLKLGWMGFTKGFMWGIDLIKKAWYKLKGLWDEDGSKKGLEQIDRQAAAREKAFNSQKKKVAKSAMDTVKYSLLAANSLSVNNDSLSDTKNKIKGALGMGDDSAAKKVEKGISTPKIAGTSKGTSPTGTKSQMSKTNEGIATGGTKNTVINVSLRNLIENNTIHGNEFKDAVSEMERQLTDGLIRVLAMANNAG